MAISYFSKNGPITIRELIDEYSDDITLLIFLIQQEPYVISEADKTQSIIANNKEPSIDASKPSTFCRDCCRKKHLGNPPKTNCPKNPDGTQYLPPLRQFTPDYKQFDPPTPSLRYPEYPYCCDPDKPERYKPSTGRYRHNGDGFESKYVKAMRECLTRKDIKSNPIGLTDRDDEDRVKIQECLNEVKLMWESQRAKDERCENENRIVKDCIAACLTTLSTTNNTPTAAGCGETPIRQTN
jgi:hypothetical protein